MSASSSPAPPPPATPSPPPPAEPCSTTAAVARRRSSLRRALPAPSRPRSLSPRPPPAWRRFRCRSTAQASSPPAWRHNPSQLTFPVIGAGQSSTAQTVTVTNSSSYAIGSVSLAAPTPFSITQNTCTGSLAAGANCTAAVVFQPSTGGVASGTLTVSSSAVATPATVALSGTGFDFSVAISRRLQPDRDQRRSKPTTRW